MSSLIEQAARRLAQIRESGIEIPGETAPADTTVPTTTPGDIAPPRYAATPAAPPLAAPLVPVPPAMVPRLADEPTVTSRRVELDLDLLAASGIVTPNAPRSNVADQYRVIKRPLILNAIGKGAVPLNHGNLIMVTSALSGEGKSFTSINLAMSIAAELDHTVMLVDADVARPSVLRMLGLPPGPGLLDLLEGHADMSNVLLRTNIDKLTLLPSGSPHPRATELLASDSMRQLLDDIATRYHDRIVIFDSPPLLLTTESRVLASHMGQIVVVVHAGRTLQADVQHALSTIESCPVRLMLLNKAQSNAHGAYGYSYGYGYGEQEQMPG
ncbi:tyrosine-protein kinase family protein [Aquincola sp. S2]|uniref:Tyrosine-protein kinase family protein n=1 Tax=Pseudaquabacterium terrae TaxID=2732868 RepID=A0ABX2EDL6_9BURK|nr:XrtA-associated tyrosine autokinase [Aquabacterium terrae]NRF66493.1 tyrosine-protein kinase family protein [Aquabacterium terrae]